MKVWDLKSTTGRKRFYQNFELWHTKRKLAFERDDYLCQHCLKKGLMTPAVDVHHIIDIKDQPTLQSALDLDNLVSLCKQCHGKITYATNKPYKSTGNTLAHPEIDTTLRLTT
jgi:5-methylcytosine-specific restriction protein A